jgi:vacuolar-type H+-ATPase subunit H
LRAEIDRILGAEREARRKVAEAEQRTHAMAEEARANRGKLIDGPREEARQQAQEVVRQAVEEAARDKERIIKKAQEEAQTIAETAEQVSSSFVQSAVRAIAGLEP